MNLSCPWLAETATASWSSVATSINDGDENNLLCWNVEPFWIFVFPGWADVPSRTTQDHPRSWVRGEEGGGGGGRLPHRGKNPWAAAFPAENANALFCFQAKFALTCNIEQSMADDGSGSGEG